MAEDEMIGWHHQFNGHEFNQALGDGEGQGSLACSNPWGRKKLDTTSFPGSSVGKESICNAGDPSWISGSERSPGEGIGYPLQYSWASLVAQLAKNLPAMGDTWV